MDTLQPLYSSRSTLIKLLGYFISLSNFWSNLELTCASENPFFLRLGPQSRVLGGSRIFKIWGLIGGIQVFGMHQRNWRILTSFSSLSLSVLEVNPSAPSLIPPSLVRTPITGLNHGFISSGNGIPKNESNEASLFLNWLSPYQLIQCQETDLPSFQINLLSLQGISFILMTLNIIPKFTVLAWTFPLGLHTCISLPVWLFHLERKSQLKMSPQALYLPLQIWSLYNYSLT